MKRKIRREEVYINENIEEGYGRDKRGDYKKFIRIEKG